MNILSHFCSGLAPKNLMRRHRYLFKLTDVRSFSLSQFFTKFRIKKHKFFKMSVVLHKVENIVVVHWISYLSIANKNNNWNVVQLGS